MPSLQEQKEKLAKEMETDKLRMSLKNVELKEIELMCELERIQTLKLEREQQLKDHLELIKKGSKE